jgi:membrane fusion protein (multidrug efflux system)
MSDNNTPTPAASAAPVAPEAPAGNGKRRRALTALAAVVIVAGGGWGLYEWLVASHYEDTDNAYVQGNVIQITPQIGGTVMAINADDTDFVKAGQPLVQLDPADAKVSLEQAEAALAQAVRQVRTLYANNGSLAAQVTLRQSDIVKAQSDIAKAQDDLQRRRALSGNGAVSKEELNHAETQLDTAKSQLAAAQAGVVAAKEALVSNQSLTEGTSVAQHPSVLAAAAKVREAYLATQRVAMPAPVDGYVAKRTVQLGQRVAAGTPMMSIVPLNQLWVDANFKEVQLRNIRIDQPVKLTADVYGKKVEYTARSRAWAWAPAARLRCCPRRTPPATGSRWCSACPCASRSTPSSSRPTRCASACRWTPRSTSRPRAARCSPTRRAAPRSRRRRSTASSTAAPMPKWTASSRPTSAAARRPMRERRRAGEAPAQHRRARRRAGGRAGPARLIVARFA